MLFSIVDVSARGLCIGCGACAVATDGAAAISLNKDGMYEAAIASLDAQALTAADRVCPFSDAAESESLLGAPNLREGEGEYDSRVGMYTNVYAGRVNDDEYLLGSSSGGMTSWIVGQLFERGEIDACISVGGAGAGSVLFQYSQKDALGAANSRKSAYSATTMDEVLELVHQSDLRFAIVGVPCYIKAARLLCEQDPDLASRLRYFIGLVCGHMKSQFFGPSMAWQLGIRPSELEEVDFRVKDPTRPSSGYSFGARSTAGEWKTAPTNTLVGSNWGHGAFQPEACNFCDDIFAETADVAFGDAWLPQYVADWRGTNVVVSRNKLVDEVIAQGIDGGLLDAESISVDTAAQSQGGNFRHRRQGLAIRLADDLREGLPVPRRRTAPDEKGASWPRRQLIRQRRRMSRVSFIAYRDAVEHGDLRIYLRAMKRESLRYTLVSMLEPKSALRIMKRTAGKIARALVRRCPKQT